MSVSGRSSVYDTHAFMGEVEAAQRSPVDARQGLASGSQEVSRAMVAGAGAMACLYVGAMVGFAVGAVKAGSNAGKAVCIVFLVSMLLFPFAGCMYWVLVHDTSPALPLQLEDAPSGDAQTALIKNSDGADVIPGYEAPNL
ncbi:uncharacterized protein AMSG_06620 [Thecamonas trahens ATCC 50062]|uniref:Uncharacterized protein n=1 Tax=Thecamonas trahens ATCC 50062 TaxID=461836 RepID=A0A0L0DF15_THETB|nr:hypothetical protein AMSG_06620 [Thecamonas trahens ATCC 50062]KNC50731.1 hypothetical protein AMSG_06620 [Thecamonas trahens ATCC 50062]|eukprot:XP_013756699.1 hypothetical protein AMSG_06620 [Thecamonas trahens ATCC 50062]